MHTSSGNASGSSALPIEALTRPFQEFASRQSAGGALMIACMIVALVLANTPWSSSVQAFWAEHVRFVAGPLVLAEPISGWVNDGLMTLFFLLVGLEIKREMLLGELSSFRLAALPIAGALGGMAVPALIYTAINWAGPAARGWGIPTATDIAFALAVLTIVGNRVPSGLRLFLTALAIADDLGAVLLIAVFYSTSINWTALAVAALIYAGLWLLNVMGVRMLAAYAVGGVALWIAMLGSGIHATVAGVLIATVVPAVSRIDSGLFLRRARHYLESFEKAGPSGQRELMTEDHQMALSALERASEQVQMPLQRMEQVLHPWVTFAIVPLFALVNSGVELSPAAMKSIISPGALGVFIGLLVGKPVGISLASYFAVRTGLAELPVDVSWRHIRGAAVLGGIGFTMSLFIATLAFGTSAQLETAKIGLLAGSLTSGVLGWCVLRRS